MFQFLFFLPVIHSWGKDAHEAIGWTVMSGLDSSNTNKMKKLFSGQDAGDVSFAFDSVQPSWHFQTAADCKPVSCLDGACLLSAIPRVYASLLDGAPLDVEGKTLSDADALKFLLNLIGDLHQPLHVSKEGAASKAFAQWESGLVEQIQTSTGNFWWSGWSHVNTLGGVWEEEKKKFSENGIEESLKKWTEENAQLACTILQKNGEDSETQGIFLRTVRDRILIAGVRAAIVAAEILSARPASAFRASGGKSGSSSSGSGSGNSSGSGDGGVWKNLIVALVVVVLFVTVTRRLDHSQKGPDRVVTEMTVTSNKLKE